MFQPKDYVIAVRSYDRPWDFKKKTYAMLHRQKELNLKERLYIFVADEEQRAIYQHVLNGWPFKEIVVGVKGGKEIVHFIGDSFLVGQPIVFMDDDLEEFFEFTSEPTKDSLCKNSTKLHDYIIDGFKTIKDTGSAFSFSYYKNEFYLQGKPWKEFRPYNLPGSFWGAYNDADFVKIYTAHLDDIIRTCRYIDRFGGVVVFHWGGFVTRTGLNSGGMQSSGDRGDSSTRDDTLKTITERVYDSDPFIRKYCSTPKIAHTGMWEVKLKSVTSIRKLRPYVSRSWSQYFQKHEDVLSNENIAALDTFFG